MKLKYVKCALCDLGNGELLYKVPSTINCPGQDGFNIVKCPECNLVYINPRIPSDEIGNFYGNNYYKKDNLRLKSLLEDDIPLNLFQRAKRIEAFAEGEKLLDVGCGGGKFLRSLNRKKWEVYGIEISETAARNARSIPGANIFVGKLEEAGFQNDFFDVVTLWHVFEHMPDPMVTIREAERILKKDGLLVIAVPNIDSFQSRFTKEKWYHLDVPYHYYHYSPETLREIIERANFKVFKVNHFVIKNFYGFSLSLLNLMGFKRNFIRNVLLTKNIERSSMSKSKYTAQLFLSLIAVPFIIIFTFFGSFIESILRKGGTIEVYARKKWFADHSRLKKVI